MPARSVVCPAHVGREEEMAVLRAAVAAVPAGGRTLLIAGEAGLGKSRLAGEALRLAETSGFRVLSGPCREGAQTAYAPMTTALRRHLRGLEDSELRQLFAGPAALAATLVAEAADALGLERSTDTTPEDLQTALWHMLRREGEVAPTMLLVEDVHWADADTLRLAGHLVEEASTLPLWLVMTYRPDELHRRHPLTHELTRWRRRTGVEELRLAPLDKEALRVMLSALFGGTKVGDEFLEAVAARTGGNPFFVEELCAVLVDRGDVYERDGDFHRRGIDEMEMPETVRETLLDRVQRLDPGTVAALRIAAVAGEAVDPRVLSEATGAGVADRALVEGLDHHLLVERHDGPLTRYAFRHALVREALADDLHGPERQRVHGRVAAALVAVHAADADAVAAEVADHHARAGNLAQAGEWSLRAARHASRQYATDAARRHYEAALRLQGGEGPERLVMLLEAAEATSSETERDASGAFAREARELAARLHDPVSEALALDVLALERFGAGDDEGCQAMATAAAELLAGRGDPAEAWALANVFRRLVTFGERERAMERLPHALAVAEHSRSDRALAVVWSSRGILAEDAAEIDQAFRRAVAHAAAAGDEFQRANALNTAGFVCAWRGALHRALEWLREAVVVSDRLFPHRGAYHHAGYAWALSLAGEYDRALLEGLPLERSSTVPARMVALTALTEVELRRGEVKAARAHAEENLRLAEASGQGQRLDPALAHLARVRLLEGPDGADDIVERFLTRNWNCFTHAFASPDLAAGLAAQGAGSRLQRFVEEVRWRTARDNHDQNRAAMLQCEAILALSVGDVAAARAHGAEAVALARAMPTPAREAECQLLLAEAEWQAGHGDACADAVEAALTVAGRLESPPLREAARALRRRTEADMVLATVLVTDIVGSTERAAALGDRAWRALLERHHEIVRRELARHRGREIDTAGDGFLAAFDGPARAIRCARAVVDALADAGLPVRAGLHTGECEVLGDKLAGIAVHVAARVAAAAGAGEVLVTATVRELVAGSGVELVERDAVTLRGLPGEWRLFAAVST
ncbi:MAG TPA: AAA family ATPase [Candidatus Dormibacteraeota bacterium]